MESLGYSDREIRTETEALEFFGLDPLEWKVKRFECSVHQGPMKLRNDDGSEEDATRNFYRVKGAFEPKESVMEARDEILALIKEAKKEAPKAREIKRPKNKRRSKRLAIPSLADIHIDKLAIGRVTGGKDAGFLSQKEIAERALCGIMEKLARDPIDEIWFPIGHDLFNDDFRRDKIPATTRGTPQQSELDWRETYRETRRWLCRMTTSLLAEIAPVKVIIVPGNHDESKCFYLGDCLEVWAENDPNVTVDNSDAFRKYYEWGNCLFGMVHSIRAADANAVMSQEAAHLWRERQYREWLIGHMHQAKNTSIRVRPVDLDRQVDGLFVRTLPALSANDEWHAQNCYVGGIPSGLGLSYDSRTGLECVFPWIEELENTDRK